MSTTADIGSPTLAHPRPTVLASAVVALAILGVLVLGGLVLIQGQYAPQGGLLGVPTRIAACGEVFARSADDSHLYTRSEVTSTAALPPIVLEPTIGEIPLLASVGRTTSDCGLYLFLHVGADAYARFTVLP